MLRKDCGRLSFCRVVFAAALVLTFALLFIDAFGFGTLSEHSDTTLMWVYITLGGVMGTDKVTTMKAKAGVK